MVVVMVVVPVALMVAVTHAALHFGKDISELCEYQEMIRLMSESDRTGLIPKKCIIYVLCSYQMKPEVANYTINSI